MTLGEKIQQLRKTGNLSQEQLAEQLSVSRQAISKWELGESIPDTDKIVKLSRIFQISTDYLLHDDINSDEDIPAVKINSETLKKQFGIKTLFIVTTGINIVGLLMSIVAQLTWKTIFAISFGSIVQIISLIIFEATNSNYTIKNENKMVHKNFYALNIWLILPFPIILLFDFIFRFYPRPRGYLVDWLLMIITYFILCGIVTFILKKKSIIDECDDL